MMRQPLLVRLALSATVLASLAACSRETADSHLTAAKSHLEHKASAAAVIELKNSLQAAPNLAEARYLLGQTLLDMGDSVGAEVQLRKAYESKFEPSIVVPALVRSMNATGQAKAAAQEFSGYSLSTAKAMAELKAELSVANDAIGANDLAKRDLAEARRLDPDNPTARLYEARALAATGDTDGALHAVETLLERAPTDVGALLLKADLLRIARADPDAALPVYRKALEQRKSLPAAHAGVIVILLLKDQVEAASRQLAEMKTFWPGSLQTRWFEGQIALRRRDYDHAVQIAEQLSASNPGSVDFLFFSAVVSIESGALQRAEGFLNRALQLAPNNPLVRRQMARLHLESGQPDKAFAEVQQLLEGTPPDVDALRIAARSQMLLGETVKADRYFTRAAELDPRDKGSRVALAGNRVARGEVDSGMAELRQIAASDTGTAADFQIVASLANRKDYAGALKAVDALEAKLGKSPIPSQLRGGIFVAMSDASNARVNFERALTSDPKYFKAVQSLAAMDVADHRPGAARARLDKFLAADPKNIEATVALARLLAASGGPRSEVAEVLDRALAIDPTAVAPRALRIEQYFSGNDTKGALAAAQAGAAAIPDNPVILELLARAQLLAGDRGQANLGYQKLAVMQPRATLPLVRLAEIYASSSDYDAARQTLQRAVALDPAAVGPHRGLVAVALAQRKRDEAIAEARALQRINPNSEVGFLFEGDVQLTLKDPAAAAIAFRKAYGNGKSTEAAVALNAALVRSGHPDEAEAFAAERLKEFPRDVGFLFALGDFALIRREYPLAQARFAQVLELAPNSAAALNNVAWLMTERQQKGATALAEKANQLQPDQPSYIDTLAVALAAEGDLDRGLRLQTVLVEKNPDSATFRLHIAQMYLQAGKKSLAKTELDRLAGLGDKYAERDTVERLLKAL